MQLYFGVKEIGKVGEVRGGGTFTLVHAIFVCTIGLSHTHILPGNSFGLELYKRVKSV